MLYFLDRLKLTPAERRLVVVIGAVVFLVLNYWLFWPRFGDFSALSREIESLQTKRDTYQKEINRRPTYEAMLRKLQATGSVLPAGEERIQFRSDMERLAREIGLAVPRWGEVLPERGSGTTTNAFFDAIGLTISQVSGSEDQFVEFLHRVGVSNSTIRVKELTLMPGNYDARSQGKTNLLGTIKLVASIQKSAPKNAPATAAVGMATNHVPTARGGTNTIAAAVARPGGTNVNAAATALRTNAIPAPVRPAARTNMTARTNAPPNPAAPRK